MPEFSVTDPPKNLKHKTFELRAEQITEERYSSIPTRALKIPHSVFCRDGVQIYVVSTRQNNVTSTVKKASQHTKLFS